MSLFSRLFQSFRTTGPGLSHRAEMVPATAATDPPAAGNGAPSAQPIHGLTALDLDRQHRAEVALLISRETY